MGTSGLVTRAVTALSGAVTFVRRTGQPWPPLPGGKPGILAQQRESLGMSLSCSTVWRCQAIRHVLWTPQPRATTAQGANTKVAQGSPLTPRCPRPAASAPPLSPLPQAHTKAANYIFFNIFFFPGLLTPAAAFQSCHCHQSGCSAPDAAKAIAEDGRSAGRRRTQQPRREGIRSPEGHTGCNYTSRMCTEALSNCYGNHFTCVGFFRLKYNYS